MRSFLLLTALAACGGDDRPETTAPPLHASTSGDESPVIEVRAIFIAWTDAEGAPPDLEREESVAETRAQTVRGLIQSEGTNFGAVAREYGEGTLETFQLERGAENELPPNAVSAAFRLAIGDVSSPLRTPRGFLLMERQPDPVSGPAEVGARHILIAHADSRSLGENVSRTREEAQARAAEVARRAQAGEDWDALHAEFTDEPDSPPGGDLGVFGRGQMVSTFEDAAFSMPVGGTSDPVESPFGFHVIQRYR